jgi:hypothetical protein
VLVHRDVDNLGLIAAKRRQRPDIGGGLHQDDVTGIDEEPGHEVERLLGAGGDHDVVRMSAHALQGHHLTDLFAQAWVALAGAVLQRDRAAFGDEFVHDLGHGVQRQCGHTRHATGEGDHLRARRHREQRADLRRGHPLGPGRVAVDVGVKAGPGLGHRSGGNRLRRVWSLGVLLDGHRPYLHARLGG